MTALLVAGLAVPLLGALTTVALGPRSRAVGAAAATISALAWAVLVSVADPPSLGRIEATPVAAAAVAGLALVVAARLPSTTLGASGALCAITVLALAATTAQPGNPDRPLAAGVAVLVVLAAVELRAEATSRIVTVAVTIAGLVVTAALALDEPTASAIAVVVGSALILALAAWYGPALAVVVPALLLAVTRSVGVARAETTTGSDLVAVTAAAAVAVAAVVLAVSALHRHRSGAGAVSAPARTARGTAVPAVAGALAAVALLAQDLASLQSAGLLVGAGAVLALAAGHPAGLVALVPGTAAAIVAFGAATELVHAGAGAAIVAAAVAGALWPVPVSRLGATTQKTTVQETTTQKITVQETTTQKITADAWPLAAAVAVVFAVVPLWGWTGADLGAYVEAMATAGAVGAAAALVVAAVVLRAALRVGARPETTGLLGRLGRRPPAVNHGSTHPLVEEDGPVGEVDTPVEDRHVEAEPIGPSQHPVAFPSRPVPRRPLRSGDGGRGRLRARPGRPPR